MSSHDDRPPLTVINQNVSSQNQSGGITAHTVHLDRRIRRSLGDELKSGLSKLPKDRPIAVMGQNGNTESMAFANDIHCFLAASGCDMTTPSATWHMFFDPPVHTVNISEGKGGKEWWIVVGPAE